MKRIVCIASVLVLGVGLAIAQDEADSADSDLKTNKQRASYAIGVSIGRSLKRDALNVDPALIARGIADAMTKDKLALTDEELQAALDALRGEAIAEAEKRQKEIADMNQKSADEFLAANKKKPGVVTLPSGLQYKVLKEGSGKPPKVTDRVRTHYRGTLPDGTVFDSSYDRGQPAVFPVGGVIKGWVEALQRMPVGAKWQLWVPAELAYGERGAGDVIGPNQMLIFEVELLGIEPADQPKPKLNLNPPK